MKNERRLIRLKGYPSLGASVRSAALEKLRRWRREEPDLENSWRRSATHRAAGMRRGDYLKLRVLFRQFEGPQAPGLPTLVRAARFLVKRFRRWAPGGAKD